MRSGRLHQAGATERRGLVLVVVAAALLARLAGAGVLGNAFHFADEAEYVDAARSLLSGQGFGASYDRSPAYPVFLAFFAWPLPPDVVLLRLAQAVVAAAGCLLVWLLGSRLFGVGAGAAAAALYALDPLMVITGGLFYPEAIAAVLLTLAVLAAWHAARDDLLPASVLAGALLGVVTLLRPVTLLTLLVVTSWTAALVDCSRARKAAHVCVAALAFVATLGPWTYRNYQVHGRLMPIATAGTQAAQVAKTEVRERGLTASLARRAWQQPVAFAKRTVVELGHFFELYPTRLLSDSEGHRDRMRAKDPRLPADTSFRPSLRDAASAFSFGPELALAIVGLVVAWRTRRRETVLLVGVILSYAFGYALFIAKLRYRVPVLPALFVLAGVGLTEVAVWLARVRASRTSASDRASAAS